MRQLTIVDSDVSGPEQPAVSLAYARQHIQALTTADDNMITIWTAAAAQYFTDQTGRDPITRTRDAILDMFPFQGLSGSQARIELPHPPLTRVLSVEYVDPDGTLRSFDDGASPETPFWTYSAPRGPQAARGFVEPVHGKCWPATREQTGAVRIRYESGYSDTPDDVPELVRGILCYLIAHFDQFRGAVHEARKGQVLELPYGVQAMIDGFRYSALPTQVLRVGPGWPWRIWPWA